MSNPLSEHSIVVASREVAAGRIALELVFETGSTNADLLGRVASLGQPTVRIAELQTAGRGRAGRRWVSAPGEALTFSLAWRFDAGLAALVGLPLAIGVVIADTLRDMGVDARLKWPNDVLKGGDKLAGILVETATGRGASAGSWTGSWAVIGVGINIALSDSVGKSIGARVADLGAASSIDRNRLLAELLDRLAAALDTFGTTGLASFIDRWNALHAWSGATVAIMDHGEVLHTGRALGIDRQGRLLLQTETGDIAVMAGDVSLRKTGGRIAP